jgi:hypothetical protein
VFYANAIYPLFVIMLILGWKRDELTFDHIFFVCFVLALSVFLTWRLQWHYLVPYCIAGLLDMYLVWKVLLQDPPFPPLNPP